MLIQFLSALVLGQVTPGPATYTQSTTTATGVVEMRTAVQKMTADGKPDVWLVGVMHIGSKKYYEELQGILDAQEVVLYEGVKPSKSAAATPPAPKSPNDPKPMYKVLSDALGLEFQLTEIKYDRPGWVNSDLSWDELDRINKEKGGGKPTSFDSVKQILDPKSPTATMLTSVLGMATPGMKEAIKLMLVKKAGSSDSPGFDPATEEVILHARNKAAIDVFAKTIAGAKAPKSVAIFYGANHMPGIEKTLKADYGYKNAEQKWVLAASADPSKMDAMGKTLYESFEKSTTPAKKSGGGGLLAAALPNSR